MSNPALEELKHSIKTHLMLMGGPTPELAVYLVKTLDFLEDDNDIRRNHEILVLTFALIESVALNVQRSIDAHKVQAERKGEIFPPYIKAKSDNLLVVIGRSRGLADLIVAKSALLREVADALRMLGTYTKIEYPKIVNIAGEQL